MTSHVPSFSAEEREMAARLARVGPHGEPSPALDARILGAAQAAAARKPGRNRQWRWPAWTGIAATLALALGGVWQLQPAREVSVKPGDTPVQVLMRKSAEPPTAEAAGADEPSSRHAPAPLAAPVPPPDLPAPLEPSLPEPYLPVADDSQLPPVDWIERIRQRRDSGDLASARASLALLQRDYPHLPLPDDVRAIASPPDR